MPRRIPVPLPSASISRSCNPCACASSSHTLARLSSWIDGTSVSVTRMPESVGRNGIKVRRSQSAPAPGNWSKFMPRHRALEWDSKDIHQSALSPSRTRLLRRKRETRDSGNAFDKGLEAWRNVIRVRQVTRDSTCTIYLLELRAEAPKLLRWLNN